MTKLLFILAWIVTFLGFNDATISTVEVADGSKLTKEQIPAIPKVRCYETTGWDDASLNDAEIDKDTTFYALYSPIYYSLNIDNEKMNMDSIQITAIPPRTFDESGVMNGIPCDTVITVHAEVVSGYKLSEWHLNNTTLNTTETTIDIAFNEDNTIIEEGNIAIYATFVKDSGTAIVQTNANANAAKVIRDGHLFIIRDGKTYNALGAEVK